MKSNIKNQADKKTGFSLTEVIVAIYILIVGIVGVMTLVIATTRSGAVSSSKLIAANLAQEGIEVIKNIRDLNYENPTGCTWACWHEWVSDNPGDYIVEYNSTALNPYVDTPLLYNPVTRLYSYDSGSPGKYNFKRKITFSLASATSTRVTSAVTWTENGQNHELKVEDDLWNWR